MLRSENLAGLAALGALALNAAPAVAQVEANSQEVHAYGGGLFGDDLRQTLRSQDGRRSSTTTSRTASAMDTTSRVPGALSCLWAKARAPSRSCRAVTWVSISRPQTWTSVRHFNSGSRFVPYVVAGLGYASADLDAPIRGTVNGAAVVYRG